MLELIAELIFLFLNLFADFIKFFKCRLLFFLGGNLQKTFVNNETSEKQITE